MVNSSQYQRIVREGKVVQEGHIDTQEKFNQLIEGLDLKGKTYLDIGCNEGEMCYMAQQLGATSTGVDAVPEHVYSCRELHPDMTFRVERGEMATGNYDVVTASAMFHYIEDRPKFMNQLARVGDIVRMDIWLDQGTDNAWRIAKYGRYIPTKAAFLHLANKYFGTVKELGQCATPDHSYREIFELSDPKPKKPQAMLVYGLANTGKTTKAREMTEFTILEIDSVHRKPDSPFTKSRFKTLPNYIVKNKTNPEYYEYHFSHIKNWIANKTNRDIVLEGFDLNSKEYREPVRKMLEEAGWEVTEKLLKTKHK